MFCIVLNYTLSLCNKREKKPVTHKKLKYKVMKQQSNSLFTQLNKQELESLTTVVKETLATGISSATHKTFSTVDLWNIHRQRRSLACRR